MIDRSRISKILVVSLTNIGDCIITLPVLAVLRAEFPEAQMDLICGKAALTLFRGSSDLGKVFVYDKKWSLRQKWAWVREIAKGNYDLVVDLRHTVIPILVGACYRTRLIRNTKLEPLSVRERHLALLSDLGLDITKRRPISLFSAEDEERMRIRTGGNRYGIIAPGANSSTKRWTVEGFETIAHYLKDEAGLNVVLVGGPNENWSKISGLGILDLTGKTSLRELAALIRGAELVVANDSAIMQLAQELDVRTVSVFGPTNPWKYTKQNERVKVIRLDLECSPCESAQCRIERRKCLDDLSPERVKEAIQTLTLSSPF